MLLLVRHGQSEANLAKLLSGRAESPLTALGHRQAAALGAALVGGRQLTATKPPRIVSSPLGRARETAAVIAAAYGRDGENRGPVMGAEPAAGGGRDHDGDVPGVEIDDRFVELDYGALEGLALKDVDPWIWQRWRGSPTWRPPGGETLAEVHERVRDGCESLRTLAAQEDVVVVSHVSPIKAGVAWIIDAGPELSWRLSLGVASITRVSTIPGSTALVGFNDCAHLSGL